MDAHVLAETAAALLDGGRGLLAMDESNGICNRKFAALGIAQDEDTRRAYREMIVSTPELGESISFQCVGFHKYRRIWNFDTRSHI